jgi:hypothetical protein
MRVLMSDDQYNAIDKVGLAKEFCWSGQLIKIVQSMMSVCVVNGRKIKDAWENNQWSFSRCRTDGWLFRQSY